MRRRSAIRSLCLSIGLIGLFGCAHGGAWLVQDDESGGVVTYLYRDDQGGPMGSRYRNDALEIMKLRCPEGYTVVREGEAKGSQALSGRDTDDHIRRRWAFQFRCKE